MECDSASSLVTEVEAGRGVALVTTIFNLVAGKRLVYRTHGHDGSGGPLASRATKGDVTPAAEKFCEILRRLPGTSSRITSVKSED